MCRFIVLLALITFQLYTFSNQVGNSEYQSIITDRSNEYLIIFNTPGLIDNLNTKGNLKSALTASSLQVDHERLKSDLFQLRKNNASTLKSASVPEFKYELYRSMNAVVMVSNNAEITEIEKLDYVKTVIKNQKILLCDNDISKDHLKSLYQPTGKTYKETGNGVKVGVIDTGIDYNNPALGGGFGPGFKVAGGYNFANMDEDPMDEVGHGTAVASIIAANGDIMGVAPNATLYAYKIFNKDTFAWSTDIDMALELAIDPNRDFDLSDHMDVINMSISIEGQNKLWLDMYTERMQKFSKLNIIICIASGNSGPSYNKINSLCLIEDVIAVGSCNSSNKISNFSSRGYGTAINSCNMKPDIVALGEDVPVYWSSSTIKTENGTSLSTPYVSGVAALLKQKHPNWTYNEYKSALLNSASDLGANFFDQGAGMVNPEASLKLSTVCYPQSVNIGFVPDGKGVEENTFSVTIYNKSSVSQEYHFNFSKSIPNGVVVSAEPSDIFISSNDSMTVIFNMKLDVEKLEYPKSGPLNFYGQFHLEGTLDSLQIPWSFLRGYYIEFYTDIKVETFFQPYVKIIKDNKVINPSEYFYNGMQYFIQQGEYDIVFYCREGMWGAAKNDTTKSYLFVKEQVNISENTLINLKKSEINNKIEFQSFNAKGELMDKSNSKMLYSLVALKSEELGIAPLVRQANTDLYYVNDINLSDKYQLLCGTYFLQKDAKEFVVINHEGLKKITSDTLLKNTPNDLNPFHFLFYPDPNEECNFGMGNYFYYDLFGVGGLNTFPLKTPTNVTLWIDVKKDKTIGLSAFPFVSPVNYSGALYPMRKFSRVYSYGDSIQFNTLFADEVILSDNRGVLQSIQKNDTVFVNNGPVYYCLSATSGKYDFNACYTDLKGMYGESSDRGYAFSNLSVNNSINQSIYTGLMKDAPKQFYTKDMTGATVEISTQDYLVMGVKGKTTLKYNLNQQGASNIFTSVHYLQFFNNKNQVRPQFNIGTKATMNLVLNYASTSKTIKLFFKYSDETEWKEHEFEISQTNFNEDLIHADVSDLLTRSAGLDLKVEKEDIYGNIMSFTSEPAIAIGNYHKNYDFILNQHFPIDTVFNSSCYKKKLNFSAYFPIFNYINWNALVTKGSGSVLFMNDSLYIIPSEDFAGELSVQIKGVDGLEKDSINVSVFFNNLKDTSFVLPATLNGEAFGTISVKYPLSRIRYKIVDETASLFVIDSLSGELYVINEDLTQFNNFEKFDLEVVATDGFSSDTAQVVVVNPSYSANLSVESMMNHVVIYPNPTTGIVKIQQAPVGAMIELYNFIGIKLHYELRVINSSPISIDLSEFKSGIYFLKVKNIGTISTFKIYKI